VTASNEIGKGKNGKNNVYFLPINRYISETTQIQLKINSKSHMASPMGSPLTLNELERPSCNTLFTIISGARCVQKRLKTIHRGPTISGSGKQTVPGLSISGTYTNRT